MKAIVFDNELKLVNDYPKPQIKENEALVKVSLIGICNTDFEITKGYMSYKGILGHEFVGVVEECNDKSWIGKRVAGEINFGCNNCEYCFSGLQRHCPNRQTLGIWNKDGCFAEFVNIAIDNLVEIPNNVADEEAVFIEPLAAANEILEQLHIKPADKVAVLGDGKLGLCIALVLKASNIDIVHIGKHRNKLAISDAAGVRVKFLDEIDMNKKFDVVVEATGSTGGFETSLNLTKPRGVLVLKSTIAAKEGLNLSKVVVDEITVLGSRCGQFKPVMRLLEEKKVNPLPLISAVYPIDKAIEAFEKNKAKDTLKVLIKF